MNYAITHGQEFVLSQNRNEAIHSLFCLSVLNAPYPCKTNCGALGQMAMKLRLFEAFLTCDSGFLTYFLPEVKN